MEAAHPGAYASLEALGGVLEAAGLPSCVLVDRGPSLPTMHDEVRVSLARNRLRVASHEEIRFPLADPSVVDQLHRYARDLAGTWRVRWVGAIGNDHACVGFCMHLPPGPEEGADAAGMRLLEATMRVHAAHQLLRQRVMRLAWDHAPGTSR